MCGSGSGSRKLLNTDPDPQQRAKVPDNVNILVTVYTRGKLKVHTAKIN